MKEINDIENLVALCPTHHWEQENGFLSLADLRGCELRVY